MRKVGRQHPQTAATLAVGVEARPKDNETCQVGSLKISRHTDGLRG